MIADATLLNDGRLVRITWRDGENRDFAARWLFDHADESRDPISGQRGHGALALERASRLEAARIEDDGLIVRFEAGGPERRIDVGRLRDGCGSDAPLISPWPTPDSITKARPIPFAAYMSDDLALRETLSRVSRWGLAVLVGAGCAPGAVERAVARFGFVRETNYGRLFDVRIEAQPRNLAFSDRPLDLHTDNPYRDPVPTLQLLHAITADDDGGATLFVDALAHAEALRREAPDAFETLARTPVRFSFGGDDAARWSFVSPVLGLDATGAVEIVRLNHRSLDLAHNDPVAVEAWYEAYLAFYRRLHAPAAAFEMRLAPGDLVIFDNRRLVHGRRAMASASPRWLQGCYADVDGLLATLARLERTGVR